MNIPLHPSPRTERRHGSMREVMQIALPLILSNSFLTLQVTIDRVLLSRYSPYAVAAAVGAVFLFYVPASLLIATANYATTFVAQYVGAGRRDRVGPAVWQAIHFSLWTGLAFLLFVPIAPYLFVLGGHEGEIPEMEAVYFQCLCFGTLPSLIVAAVSGFFGGRGDSWTVLLINAVGFGVNVVLDYLLIFGVWGFPEWGIAGAGWATVVGNWVSAVVGLALMLRSRYQHEFATLSGWRFDRELFLRLMRYGLPSGAHWALDTLSFTAFLFLTGWIGAAEMSASGIAFTLNMIAFLPAFGIGQAVSILVGQRLGENRPELAERSTWAGFRLALGYMVVVSLLYVAIPGLFVLVFASEKDAEMWAAVAAIIPVLLRFVAAYSLFDSMNVVFSMALKGAGDTWFVSLSSVALAWPMMILPTWAAWYYGWGLWWAWTFGSAYIMTLAVIYWRRFVGGKWKSMRVIEPNLVA